MEKRQSLLQMVLRRLDSHMKMNEVRAHPRTIHKIKLEMVERVKYKTWHHKTPRREHRQDIL